MELFKTKEQAIDHALHEFRNNGIDRSVFELSHGSTDEHRFGSYPVNKMGCGNAPEQCHEVVWHTTRAPEKLKYCGVCGALIEPDTGEAGIIR